MITGAIPVLIIVAFLTLGFFRSTSNEVDE